jgi:hypothetical protein
MVLGIHSTPRHLPASERLKEVDVNIIRFIYTRST